jgi:exosortase
MKKIPALRATLRSPAFILCALCALTLFWSYLGTFAALGRIWWKSPQYSHGFLVPAFAAAILWMRWGQFRAELAKPSNWGLPFIVLGGAIRLAGGFFYFPWLDELSLIPTLVGLALLLGGWHALQWSWPAIGFLVFMLPLPFVVETWLSDPLQVFATQASTYVLQTLGFPALSQGNIIILNDSKIGVEEACNGLGMLDVFLAASTAWAFMMKRPLWEKGLVMVSGVPIALIANVMRITATGVLCEWAGSHFAITVFHDWWGWLMMPLALALLWLETRLLSWLVAAPTAMKPASPTVLVPGLPVEIRARTENRPGIPPRMHNQAAMRGIRP